MKIKTPRHQKSTRVRYRLGLPKKRSLNRLCQFFSVERSLRTWIEAEASAKLLSIWSDGGALPSPVNLSHPRWLMIFSTVPDLLDTAERQACKMLMGLSAPGALPTDWKMVMQRASQIFDAASRLANQSASLHMYNGLRYQSSNKDAGHPYESWCDGRCYLVLPTYGSRAVRSSQTYSEHSLFDRRRVSRRRHQPVPASWTSVYGALASQLWVCGLSRQKETTNRFEPWVSSIHAVAQAMTETGLKTYLCPEFFSNFPRALDNRQVMEQVDEHILDELRTRWLIEQNTQTPFTVHPSKRSL